MASDFENDDYFANLPEDVVQEALKPPAAWPEGRYDATIIEAVPYQGEGKPYPCVKLTVNVTNSEGRTRKMSSWVLSKNPTRGAQTVGIQFLAAVGLKHGDYRNPAQLVGLSGRVNVEIKNEFNQIKGWVVPSARR